MHVVSSPAAASTMVRRCSIHTVFIACDSNDDMRGLITALEELKIPHVFTGAGAGENFASELTCETRSLLNLRKPSLGCLSFRKSLVASRGGFTLAQTVAALVEGERRRTDLRPTACST